MKGNLYLKEYQEYLNSLKRSNDSYANKIVTDSDNIINNKYVFDLNWDMEQCNQLYYFVPGINRPPNNDAEWIYNYARLEYLRKLIFAYKFTENEKYKLKYCKFLTIFYKHTSHKYDMIKNNKIVKKIFNKLNIGVSLNRTLDIAMRNISLAIDYFYNKDFFKQKIINKIINDREYIYNNLREFDETSNWGVIIVSSYLITSFIFGNNARKIEFAFERLHRMLKKQIRSDGSHIESASMYHIDILINLLRIIYFSKIYNFKCPDDIIYIAKKMTYYANDLCDPNGYQIMYGDSDYTNISSVMFVASKILNLNDITIKGVINDYHLIAEFAKYSLEIFKDNFLSDEKNISKIKLLEESGKFIYDDEKYSIRGFNESYYSGHKHADNGEVVLYYKSKPIFIDCGRFSYMPINNRYYLMGKNGHNICFADEGLEWENIDNWRLKHRVMQLYNQLDIEGNLVSYSLSYNFNDLDIEISRKIIIVDNCIFVISKCDKSKGKVINSLWNLSDNIKCELINDNQCLIKSDDSNLYFYTDGQISMEDGMISYHYNQVTNNKKIVVKNNFNKNLGIQIVCIAENLMNVEFKLIKNKYVVLINNKSIEIKI